MEKSARRNLAHCNQSKGIWCDKRALKPSLSLNPAGLY